MHRTVGMLTIALVMGIAVGIIGNQLLIAQQAPLTRTILQQKNMEGVVGKEVIMYGVETIPGEWRGDTITLGRS